MKDKKSLKEKWKAHLPHKRGAEEKQKKGTEDTGFTIRLARFIIEKRECKLRPDQICSFHGPVQHGTGCDEEGVWISGNGPADAKGCEPVRSQAI